VSRSTLAAAVLVWGLCGMVTVWAAAADAPNDAAKTVPCAECGMTAAIAGRFTARILSAGETRYFCDIGDLVVFIVRTQPKEYAASVRDFWSGEWLDAATAVFVIDKKTYATPMGWGVAAFRARAAAPAPALDFEALRKALR
jgi:nitrous oxide reductase accessory protein NosL